MLSVVLSIVTALALAVVLYFRLRYRRPALAEMPPMAEPKKKKLSRSTAQQGWSVCVTGGAGNLGAQLIKVLLTEYADRVQSIVVFDMVRGKVEDERVRYVTGNLVNYADVLAVTKGCNVVFHCASLIDLRSAPRHWNLLYNVNVVGAHNVVEACHANGIEALVYTGSMAGRKEVGCDFREAMRTERTAAGDNNIFEVDPEATASYYGKSKNLGERAVIAGNARDGSVLRAAAVLPCVVYGVGDRFQYDGHVEHIRQGKPTVGILRISEDEGGVASFSWNTSCARLHAQCAEALLDPERRDDVGGHSFYASDYEGSYADFNREIDRQLSAASGGVWAERTPLFKVLPRPLVTVMGSVASAIDWLYDGQVRNPIFQLAYLDQMRAYAVGDLSCRSDNAIKHLGYRPAGVSSHKTIAEEIWALEQTK